MSILLNMLSRINKDNYYYYYSLTVAENELIWEYVLVRYSGFTPALKILAPKFSPKSKFLRQIQYF